MSIRIVKEPLLTTVQDLGRRGYQNLGINPNGAMDRTAARIANVLSGNEESAAVLEMHFPAGQMEFEASTVFCLAGADFGAELDGESIEVWKACLAESGSSLRFASRRRGSRVYMAVAGGFNVDERLGSRSTNLAARMGGMDGRRLRAGDRIGFGRPSDLTHSGLRVSRTLIPFYSRFPTVRVIHGPEFEWLTEAARDAFTSETFGITTDSNRMGYRLAGEPLFREIGRELVSTPVCFGTVQLLPDGQLIVLMADHGTTGGYPRIANIIAADLPLAAQLDAGDKIGFQVVTVEEAEELWFELERELGFLKVGVRFAGG